MWAEVFYELAVIHDGEVALCDDHVVHVQELSL